MWTRDLTELLILLYGQHENLYDIRHRDYLNRVKRSNSLFQIYERLKEMDPKVTVEAIRSKIHGMRSQYLKEVNEVKASKRSGAGADDVYVPKLWWFTQMEFLRPHTNSRPSSSNRCDNNKENETSDVNHASDNLYEDSFPGTSQSFTSQACTLSPNTPSPNTPSPSSSPSPMPCKKKKLSAAFSEQIDGVKCLVSKRLNERNEYEWLTKLVEFEFKKLNDEGIKRESAWKIQSILRDAALEDRALSNATTKDKQSQPPTLICTPVNTAAITRPTPVVGTSASGTGIQATSMRNDILHQSLLGILDGEEY